MLRQTDKQVAAVVKKNITKSNNHWSRKNHLVKTMSIVSCAILTILLVAQLAHSIIIPPKFYMPFHHYPDEHIHSTDEHNKLAGDESEPYVLSITDGDSLSVSLNSESHITVNLNRIPEQDVSALITVHSGPDLISFDKQKYCISNTSFTTENVKSFENSSSCRVLYPKGQSGDREITFHTNNVAGHAEIVAKIIEQPKNITIDDKTAYISIDIYKSASLKIVIQIVGWIYFFAWSISFYFQFILNYQRKSVVGLNFDFLALNLLGFTCYAIFNAALLFSDSVQHEYYNRYTYSRIPVEYNDLFFAVHAVIITILTIFQCFIYEVS